MQATIRRLLTAATVAALVGMSGCAVSSIRIPESPALAAEEDSAAFLDRMSSCENVSESDAMRGMLILVKGDDPTKTFEQRVQLLRDKGVVASGWSCDAERPITKGKFAYMIYQASKIPGGVVLTLTGPTQRYCLRELQYQEMMTEGTLFTPVSGVEFVDVLTRADTYIRTGKIPDKAGQVDQG